MCPGNHKARHSQLKAPVLWSPYWQWLQHAILDRHLSFESYTVTHAVKFTYGSRGIHSTHYFIDVALQLSSHI